VECELDERDRMSTPGSLFSAIRQALAVGRATAIARALENNPEGYGLAAEVAKAKEPFDVALVALDDFSALLQEAWAFPEFPGPGEGLVSTEDDYPAQDEWREKWDALDAKIKAALDV
jgi:hypothetical protein